MATSTVARGKTSPTERRDFERWQARRRWARAGIVYTVMLFFALLFIGPLFFATVSSLKIDPLEYPPTLAVPQLSPKNWAGAARLGAAGAGDRWFGGFAPGAEVPFEVTYFVPEGGEAVLPEPEVPRRQLGASAASDTEYAADYATLTPVEEIAREAGHYEVGGEMVPGELITYGFSVLYRGEGPEVGSLPLDILTPQAQSYVSSTITAHRLERRGRVASFDNVAPGVIGYIFHNYIRVFSQVRSAETGESLFWAWTLNTLYIAVVRVAATLLFAPMAGYALARLNFPGKATLFVIILFSMMVPAQVTFISNYLVLRDGIFGLTGLFGVETLLNNLWGVIILGLAPAGMVFLMKQFFESIPREVEEAAMIDGASQWRRYWSVVMPMARPALGAVAILTFQGAWNEFFWPLVILTAPERIKTLPIGLLSFRQTYGAVGDWGLILAGAVLSAVPIIILFIVFQKYFLEGVSYGGSKE
jgi:multiple sugar transport system permease protein